MGSLHIWKGNVDPTGYKYTWHVNGREADLYLQEGMGAEQFKSELPRHKAKQLTLGYCVTANVYEEHLPE